MLLKLVNLDDPLVYAVELFEVDVSMIVPEIPTVELDSMLSYDVREERCLPVRTPCYIHLSAVEIVFRSTVSDDVINLEVMCSEVPDRLIIFFVRRDFSAPPGLSFDAVFLVRGLCSAHCEDRPAVNLIDLPAHKMYNRVRDPVYLAAMPFLHRVPVDRVMILMVAIDKTRREVTFLVRLNDVFVRVVLSPNASEVACNNDEIVFAELLLLRKILCVYLAPVIVAMRIACYENA